MEVAQIDLFDTHCHLDVDAFDATRDQWVTKANQAGVNYMLVPSIGTIKNWTKVTALKKRYGTLTALGLHPLYTPYFDHTDLAQLEAWISREKPVAIGEIGLDNWPGSPDFAQQEKLFAAQLTIAKQHHLPVILHVRRAIDQALKQLRAIPVLGGIVHAFNGSMQQANQLMALNFKLGFGSSITYNRAHRIRRLATALPDEAIVLETDAPDMLPAWTQQIPAALQDIKQYAAILAYLRGQPVEEVAARTTQNAFEALFIAPSTSSRLHVPLQQNKL